MRKSTLIPYSDGGKYLIRAKENNKEALDKAVKDWYANAKDIGSFLASANPKNWTANETQGALEMHITHTIAYSVHLADILTEGIAKQFPDKF